MVFPLRMKPIVASLIALPLFLLNPSPSNAEVNWWPTLCEDNPKCIEVRLDVRNFNDNTYILNVKFDVTISVLESDREILNSFQFHEEPLRGGKVYQKNFSLAQPGSKVRAGDMKYSFTSPPRTIAPWIKVCKVKDCNLHEDVDADLLFTLILIGEKNITVLPPE